MDFGETWWKRILQTSRSFLNQNFQNQNRGKPKFKGQHFRVNPKNFNDYFRVSITMDFGETWWKWILQASRSFLNRSGCKISRKTLKQIEYQHLEKKNRKI